MGGLRTWIDEWRETYRAYPVATVATWGEMILSLWLVVGAMLVLVAGGRASDIVSISFLATGVVFVVWFTVLRQPVFERLVER